MNNEYSQKLGALRLEIDKIDEKILKLLQERLEIVKNVKEVKSQNGEEFFIKSAREADMIRDLLKKADTSLQKSAIVDIWRKIITSANCLEQPLQIALHNPNHVTDYKYILRQYYADFVPIINHVNINNILSDIEKNKAQIAVFSLPNNDSDACDNWWVHLCNNKAGLKVFAKLPFLAKENSINLVALAKKSQEKSQKDKTIFCIETMTDSSKSQVLAALKELRINAKILKSTQIKSVANAQFHLVEADGFYEEKSTEIEKLKKQTKFFVSVLGCYADV